MAILKNRRKRATRTRRLLAVPGSVARRVLPGNTGPTTRRGQAVAAVRNLTPWTKTDVTKSRGRLAPWALGITVVGGLVFLGRYLLGKLDGLDFILDQGSDALSDDDDQGGHATAGGTRPGVVTSRVADDAV